MTAFNPPITPSIGSSYNPEVKLLKAEFGDGYTQARPAGINHIKQTASLRWEVVTTSEHDAIIAFFKEHGGFKAFNYTLPQTTAPLAFTCEEWNSRPIANGLWSIDATFRQSYNGLV